MGGDLCPAAVDVCGVVLPYVGQRTAERAPGDGVPIATAVEAAYGPRSPRSEFIATASATANLRSAALALTLHMPVLLEGVTGAGKTALLEHLAHLTGHTGSQHGLLKIQMGDQTDAKVRAPLQPARVVAYLRRNLGAPRQWEPFGKELLARLTLVDTSAVQPLQVLLGSYVCTAVPGRFRYQEGVLTQAVKAGRYAL